jgi:hypothetical protein
MEQIRVTTYFDCTQTNTTSYRKVKNSKTFTTAEEWDYSRNQQRNFETILQCVSLRATPDNISVPVYIEDEDGMKHWTFNFSISHNGAFATEDDETGLLKESVFGVPMIVGLSDSYKEGFLVPYLVASGEKPNIFFEIIKDATK